MKKSILVLILVLAILASVVTGTLAVYQASIDEMVGDVVAKKFVFTGEGQDGFNHVLKIAPGDGVKNKNDVIFTFSLSNFEGTNVSETPMMVNVEIQICPKEVGKSIVPLKYVFTKIDMNGNEVANYQTIENVKENETVSFKEYFPLDKEGQTYSYKIQVIWPEPKSDANYLDTDFLDCGNTIKVNATATQYTNKLDSTEEAQIMAGEVDDFKDDLQTEAQRKAFMDANELTYLSNDILKKVFQSRYDLSLPFIYNNNEVLLIQPYFIMDKARPVDVVLFAVKTDAQNWYTYLTFDDEKGIWRESFVNGKTSKYSLNSVKDEHGNVTKAAIIKFIRDGGELEINGKPVAYTFKDYK